MSQDTLEAWKVVQLKKKYFFYINETCEKMAWNKQKLKFRTKKNSIREVYKGWCEFIYVNWKIEQLKQFCAYKSY